MKSPLPALAIVGMAVGWVGIGYVTAGLVILGWVVAGVGFAAAIVSFTLRARSNRRLLRRWAEEDDREDV